MRTIKKFELRNMQVRHLKLGKRSQIIKVAQSVTPGNYYVWVTIWQDEPQTTWYKFVLVGADDDSLGDEHDDLEFVGTLEGPNSPMFHVFFGVDND